MEDYTKTYNRLLHILNRNILLKERKFSTQEIIDCFKKNNYDDLTNREKVLVSKLFKEIKDIYDLKAILSAYESSEFFLFIQRVQLIKSKRHNFVYLKL